MNCLKKIQFFVFAAISVDKADATFDFVDTGGIANDLFPSTATMTFSPSLRRVEDESVPIPSDCRFEIEADGNFQNSHLNDGKEGCSSVSDHDGKRVMEISQGAQNIPLTGWIWQSGQNYEVRFEDELASIDSRTFEHSLRGYQARRRLVSFPKFRNPALHHDPSSPQTVTMTDTTEKLSITATFEASPGSCLAGFFKCTDYYWLYKVRKKVPKKVPTEEKPRETEERIYTFRTSVWNDIAGKTKEFRHLKLPTLGQKGLWFSGQNTTVVMKRLCLLFSYFESDNVPPDLHSFVR